jgi:hypothetical protein
MAKFNRAEITDNGKLPAYAWPGGYPIYYLCADGEVLCAECASSEESVKADPTDKDWFVVGMDCNYEDDCMHCAHCNKQIECAYPADKWEVIVGNVGTVYSGSDESEARAKFASYVETSKSGVGRAGGESVTLMKDSDIAEEFIGALQSE